MKNVLVTDLDGTVCNVVHRLDYAKAAQWDDFHSRLGADTPFEDVTQLINVWSKSGGYVLAVTGRNNRWRQPTIDWLVKNDVSIDAILMRPDMDFRRDGELKIELMEEHFGSRDAVLRNVAFILEDRDIMVEVLRNYGLPVWQVRAGDY